MEHSMSGRSYLPVRRRKASSLAGEPELIPGATESREVHLIDWVSETVRTVRRVSAPVGRALASSLDVESYVRGILAELDQGQEHFLCLALDSKNRVTAWKVVSSGTLTVSLVHPREVFHFAIVSKACGIVVSHNHPSGDPEPSPDDQAVTRRLVTVGEVLGIEVRDHVVVGDPGRYVSFLDRGLLV